MSLGGRGVAGGNPPLNITQHAWNRHPIVCGLDYSYNCTNYTHVNATVLQMWNVNGAFRLSGWMPRCPAISYVCWHNRKWQPPFMRMNSVIGAPSRSLLRRGEVNRTYFFIWSIYKLSVKEQKGQQMSKTPTKRCFFLAFPTSYWVWPCAMFQVRQKGCQVLWPCWICNQILQNFWAWLSLPPVGSDLL